MQTRITLTLLMLCCSIFTTMITAQTIFGITNDAKIVSFAANSPKTIMVSKAITGIAKGQTIVGLDTRPATGEIFALGYNATNDTAMLYVINPMTGIATPKPMIIKLPALGSEVGFDFNPTVDRIRLVSKTGKNYRLNPNNGAIAATDLALNYAANDINAGKTPAATTCAYTNSYIAATATQLFTYDENLRILTFQNPPNDGILNTRVPISGISASSQLVDFDIVTNTATYANMGFAVAKTGAKDSLFMINTTTGALTKIDEIGANIVDIAIAIDRKMPVIEGKLAYGLTFTAGNSAFNLISFDTKKPAFIRSARTIAGIKKNQNIVGMDFRPQDNKLYALGYRMTDSIATIYTLNDSTGMLSVHPGADSFKLALMGQVSFDFNPAANRLRIMSAANRNNYRLNLTVNPITATLDTSLTYKNTDINAGKTPLVVTGAYTKNFAGTTATQLYDIDATLGNFVNQRTANGGFLNTVGDIGLMLDPNDYSIDLDIHTTPNSAIDTAFLAANISGSNGFDNLYTLNIATGKTTLVDRIGYGIAVRNIAIVPSKPNVSSKDLPTTLQAKIYPSPTNGFVTIDVENKTASEVSVVVFNVQGQQVYQQNFNDKNIDFKQVIDLNNLNAGIYFIKINTSSETMTAKIIKE
jgi:trimeric autotransporter adhesin